MAWNTNGKFRFYFEYKKIRMYSVFYSGYSAKVYDISQGLILGEHETTGIPFLLKMPTNYSHIPVGVFFFVSNKYRLGHPVEYIISITRAI